MVNIDDVYQKVLVLANKEQRGYITPQEFNLLADKAQLDIFDSYFHDIKTAQHKPFKNQMEGSDDVEMLEEKRAHFRESRTLTTADSTSEDGVNLASPLSSGNILTIPTNVYKIAAMYLTTTGDLTVAGTTTLANPVEITRVNRKEWLYMNQNPLLRPTLARPVYLNSQNTTGVGTVDLEIHPDSIIAGATVILDCWEVPSTPQWAYVIIGEKALYNANLSVNFQLHPSEEETLVTRILELAGIVINRQDILEAAMRDRLSTIQQQNN